jgi:hypothetical protein
MDRVIRRGAHGIKLKQNLHLSFTKVIHLVSSEPFIPQIRPTVEVDRRNDLHVRLETGLTNHIAKWAEIAYFAAIYARYMVLGF